jgi:putative ABC transport system substrate-binding protein
VRLKRRDFITLLGGAAAWPLAARAQQLGLPVIGFLGTTSPDEYGSRLRAFQRGLSEAGFFEGKNVSIVYRWAEAQYDRLPGLAADLVRHRVRVIIAFSGVPPAMAAKAATTTIPVVFITGSNPVQAGLVASLNSPGGNLTGVTSLGGELGPKRLEILHELVPAATEMGFLINPTNPYDRSVLVPMAQAAANVLGLKLRVLYAGTEHEISTIFANLSPLGIRALVISPDTLFTARTEQVVELAAHHALPTIYAFRESVDVGGLMSYGASTSDSYRVAGSYVGRILNGEKPADLPVQQSTKVELIINLKTAKALGLTVPLTLRGRADEVIE